MVVAIIGESCTGKSTLAGKLKIELNSDVYSGKDYLRLAKNQTEAEKAFKELLARAADGGENIIYVISEKPHLALLPENCYKVLVTCDLPTIKRRFAERMHGNLPAPVEAMLERNHGAFDNIDCNFRYGSEECYTGLLTNLRSKNAN